MWTPEILDPGAVSKTHIYSNPFSAQQCFKYLKTAVMSHQSLFLRYIFSPSPLLSPELLIILCKWLGKRASVFSSGRVAVAPLGPGIMGLWLSLLWLLSFPSAKILDLSCIVCLLCCFFLTLDVRSIAFEILLLLILRQMCPHFDLGFCFYLYVEPPSLPYVLLISSLSEVKCL